MKQKNTAVEKSLCYVDSPIGILGIAEDGKGISDLYFGRDGQKDGMVVRDAPLLGKAAEQLSEYFRGHRELFDLPLSMQGTDFQIEVWDALRDIPYGATRSYKQVAEHIGRPKAFRAVGMANNRNPVSIIVPCHRVIGHNGSLVGYGGGLMMKDYLLRLERKTVVDNELHLLDYEIKDLDDVDKHTW